MLCWQIQYFVYQTITPTKFSKYNNLIFYCFSCFIYKFFFANPSSRPSYKNWIRKTNYKRECFDLFLEDMIGVWIALYKCWSLCSNKNLFNKQRIKLHFMLYIHHNIFFYIHFLQKHKQLTFDSCLGLLCWILFISH